MENLKNDAIKLCIQSSQKRLTKIKSGKNLDIVIKTQENNENLYSCNPNVILTQIRNKSRNVKARQVFKRSLSGKNRCKSSNNLPECFAEKFRKVSVKLDDYNRRCSALFLKRRVSCKRTTMKPIPQVSHRKEDYIDKKIAEIDREIINELYGKDEKSQNISKFDEDLGKVKGIQEFKMKKKMFRIKRKQGVNMSSSPDISLQSRAINHDWSFEITPDMVKSSVKRVLRTCNSNKDI